MANKEIIKLRNAYIRKRNEIDMIKERLDGFKQSNEKLAKKWGWK